MNGDVVEIDEIEVEVRGAFTSHHSLQTEAGEWGVITFPFLARAATFSAPDGRVLVMKGTHWFRSAWQMSEGDTVLATASAKKLLRREIEVELAGDIYRLVPEGVLRRGWFLADALGNRLLELRPKGALRRGAALAIVGPVDADLIVFAYYLMVQRQEQESTTAAVTVTASLS